MGGERDGSIVLIEHFFYDGEADTLAGGCCVCLVEYFEDSSLLFGLDAYAVVGDGVGGGVVPDLAGDVYASGSGRVEVLECVFDKVCEYLCGLGSVCEAWGEVGQFDSCSCLPCLDSEAGDDVAEEVVHIDVLGCGDDEACAGDLDEGVDESVHGGCADVDHFEGFAGALLEDFVEPGARLVGDTLGGECLSDCLAVVFEDVVEAADVEQGGSEVVRDDVDDCFEFFFLGIEEFFCVHELVLCAF